VDKRDIIKAYTAWGAVCLFWGTTYLAIRIGVEVVPPALFAGIRFAFAGSIIYIFLRLKGLPNPSRQDLPHLAVVGILLLITANGVVVWAEQWVPSGLAALIVATVPFWMVSFEAALPTGDKLNFRKVSGIIIGFAGLVLLLGPDLKGTLDKGYLKGILAMFFAPCSWAAGSIYSKYRPVKSHPMMAAAFQMLIAGTLLILIGAAFGEFQRFEFDIQGLAALAYLLVFGSIVGYGSYIYALTKLPASKVSMYAYINPVIAVILGWLVLGERFDWVVVTATVVVLFGVVLVKTASSQKKPVKPSIIIDQKEVIEEEKEELI
jgi:drug/metabolite transporter (DMT)-like permease